KSYTVRARNQKRELDLIAAKLTSPETKLDNFWFTDSNLESAAWLEEFLDKIISDDLVVKHLTVRTSSIWVLDETVKERFRARMLQNTKTFIEVLGMWDVPTFETSAFYQQTIREQKKTYENNFLWRREKK